MTPEQALRQLPVRAALPALRDALDRHGAAVLAAPPGTGKTTLVPLDLAGLTRPGRPPRRVLVAEPRRIAARAAARRMAWLLGERAGGSGGHGGRVGYTVRGDRRAGPETVVEVVTTGVLLQRLQRDPELPGVDVVLLDECHERHLDADTAAAFLLDVRAALRPELRLVAASATTDTAAWAALLGDAPVVTAQGAAHPVETVWAPPPRPVRPPHGMAVDPALLAHTAQVVRRALAERQGDVLCFLPGAGEISKVAALLADVRPPEGGGTVQVLGVHGRAPAEVQDAVLAGGAGGAGGDRRRVVLATAVAESSLTVPGVRVVVDSGLAREPRTDHARGLGALTTVRASRATAGQRAGRAGREGPGTVYRCWAEGEHARLPRFPSPEIAVADLTAFALHAACWGAPPEGDPGLALLDPPPAGALTAAREVLRAAGALDGDGRPTGRGRRMARMGLHPRLARALLDGAARVGVRRAAEVVALLSEEPPRSWGDDLPAVWRTARRSGTHPYAARWRQETRRLRAAVTGAGAGAGDDAGDGAAGGAGDETGGAGPDDDGTAAGIVAALAYPERVARERAPGSYLMASGTRAEVAGGSPLRAARWLAVAAADRPVGAAGARVLLAAPVDGQTAREAAGALLRSAEEVLWDPGRRDVTARRAEWLGAILLREQRLDAPDPERVRAALLDGLRREGVEDLLEWTPAARGLRQRMAFLHRELGAPWPDVSEEALAAALEDHLPGGARGRADLRRLDVHRLLTALLPWADGSAAQLDEWAPERIEVPCGSRVRVDYGGERPVLAVKLQELFGWQEAPRIAGGRVPLLVHLLSPAGRPVAVTSDLASFWRDGYRSVRAELRGRYPRHPWPEDPATAQATRRARPRRPAP
ncbi:ATP-dependent helicase HrpB [Streptomyces sp. YIM 98790]|uniref:ATP-dependent helicase HrpB n=1 Tax=Streptomyces sp. YIM 98790 TaxID=2689077 RepID=UPI0028BD4D9E|nr:ATP-dependent helicase HrpB [Streptomyces sp. YIM 98790]